MYQDPALPADNILTRKFLNVWIGDLDFLAQGAGFLPVGAVAIAGTPDGIAFVKLEDGEILYRGADGIGGLRPPAHGDYVVALRNDLYPEWRDKARAVGSGAGRINEATRWGV